ncbi:60S ribosomal protein L6 [Strongyloides ratti]|uniref:Large ribosomal subunit protein eL6 n=1 Tax=Strongyloides ratti TaxID=34506 RepID=A0A090MWW2_STRRB|nr:60S ribosomal protein L6 [Strongyloides ratti]CEF64379.1 60S ribosomal protein L6 [Strongyloides ratti]
MAKKISMPKSANYATGLMRFSLAHLAKCNAIVKKGKNPKKRTPKTKRSLKVPKLSSKITPGTVVVILAGRYAGKRVVFLKQMEKSGLLLVTGPFSINGVPVRRIAQKFVLPTSTKIDVSGVKVPDNMTDDYFKRTKYFGKEKKDIFEQGKQEYTLTEARKADQKTIDTAVLGSIKKNPEGKFLAGYLRTNFGLSKRQYPHNMVF